MKQLWSPQELDDFWLLSDSEIEFCKSVYSASQLAVALQLKFLEHEGRFPSKKNEIAALVIRFVARQLGIPRESLDAYGWGGQSSGILSTPQSAAALRRFRGVTESIDERCARRAESLTAQGSDSTDQRVRQARDFRVAARGSERASKLGAA